jgi:hypothetical protein
MSVYLTTFLALVVSMPFSTVPQVRQQDQQRRTALGTPVAMSNRKTLTDAAARNGPQPKLEPSTQVFQRALEASGGRQSMNGVVDVVADGTVTFYSSGVAQQPLPVTLIRKGDRQVQRTIKYPSGERRQGTNGSQTWDSFGHQWTAAAGPALDFIETNTARGLQNLFDFESRGSKLHDDGMRGAHRALTIEESNGRTTTYVIDTPTSRVTTVEFVSGQAGDMFGLRRLPIVETFVFSDFRRTQALWTPFRIEHYSNGLKIEELQFTSIRFNTSQKDEVFHP